MKKAIIFVMGAAAGACVLLAGIIPFVAPGSAQPGDGPGKGGADKSLFAVAGRTKCIAANKAIIAPTVLHPVEEIYVSVGDRVKKGDKLVLIDSDEPKA